VCPGCSASLSLTGCRCCNCFAFPSCSRKPWAFPPCCCLAQLFLETFLPSSHTSPWLAGSSSSFSSGFQASLPQAEPKLLLWNLLHWAVASLTAAGTEGQFWEQQGNLHFKSTLQAGHRGSNCNPSYLGGRDEEDQGLKPALSKSS
jgi:hypothetical protein